MSNLLLIAKLQNNLHKQFNKSINQADKPLYMLLRLTMSFLIIIGVWQAIVMIFELPSFILPAPLSVFERLIERHDVLFRHSLATAQEIVFGLLLGLSMGLCFALQMLLFKPLKRWLLPILIISQAIPVFAIAPILMLWLGYGISSKVVMAAIIIFFMGATKWQMLRRIQFPASLPTLASGIRVAVVIAPIGAVAGEWVGSSEGLGYLMLQANARMLIDEMFAALFILSALSVCLYFITDKLLKKFIPWEA